MDKDGLQKCLLLIQCNVRREYVTAIRLKDMVKEIELKTSLNNWFEVYQ